MKQVSQFLGAQTQGETTLRHHKSDSFAVEHFIHPNQIERIGQSVNRLTEVDGDTRQTAIRGMNHGC